MINVAVEKFLAMFSNSLIFVFLKNLFLFLALLRLKVMPWCEWSSDFFFVIKLELWISKFGNVFPSLFWVFPLFYSFFSTLSFRKPWLWIFGFLDIVVFLNVPSWFTFHEKTQIYLLVIFLIWTMNPYTLLDLSCGYSLCSSNSYLGPNSTLTKMCFLWMNRFTISQVNPSITNIIPSCL